MRSRDPVPARVVCSPRQVADACARFPRDPVSLAVLAGITPSTLQRMRQGARVRRRSVQRLARVLGVDPADLLAPEQTD